MKRKIYEILEAKDLLEDMIYGMGEFSMAASYELYVMQDQLNLVEDFFFKQLYSLVDETHISENKMTEEETKVYNLIIESEIIINPFRMTFEEFMGETNLELNDEDKRTFGKLFDKKFD